MRDIDATCCSDRRRIIEAHIGLVPALTPLCRRDRRGGGPRLARSWLAGRVSLPRCPDHWSTSERVAAACSSSTVSPAPASHASWPRRSAARGHGVLWLEGRCLSFGRGLSYWPFIDILKEAFGITERDSEVEALSKLETSVRTLFDERAPESCLTSRPSWRSCSRVSTSGVSSSSMPRP